MLRHTSIVDSQKLVGSSSHVNEVMFSFGAFLVHELENGIIRRRVLQNNGHDLKQCFAQSGGTAFGDRAGLRIKVSGLKRRGV